MKSILAALILVGMCPAGQPSQPPNPGGPRGGFPGFGEPARRTEMMADRLAEDLGLSQDQRKEVKGILDQTQAAAKPLQDELQTTRKSLKDAVTAGKPAGDLEPLHQQIGATTAKLAAVQSAAFAEAIKLLKEDQRIDAGILYEVLGMVASPIGRPSMSPRSGPGGPPGPGDSGGHPSRGRGGSPSR